jgi:hypothetical protein
MEQHSGTATLAEDLDLRSSKAVFRLDAAVDHLVTALRDVLDAPGDAVEGKDEAFPKQLGEFLEPALADLFLWSTEPERLAATTARAEQVADAFHALGHVLMAAANDRVVARFGR